MLGSFRKSGLPGCFFRRKRWKSTRPVVDSEVSIDLGEWGCPDPLRLSFGKLARMADGSCVASQGGTSVLVTAVSPSDGEQANEASSFVPLTVDYRQKSAAAGRIPTNFLRRELGASDQEVLTSRVIDRALRPLFPKGFSGETQIVANLLAVDAVYDPVVLALNAASASLATSSIPWNGPLGAVRVGYTKEGGFVINPQRRILHSHENLFNLVVAGTSQGHTIMLEAEAKNLDRSLFLDGVSFGLEGCAAISRKIHAERKRREVSKRPVPLEAEAFAQTERDVALLCEQRLRAIFSDPSHDKTSRGNATFAVRDMAVKQLKKTKNVDASVTNEAFVRVCRSCISTQALDDRLRVDGRSVDEIREISCEVDLHEPLHGSALFQRGQTQVFCTVALDSPESALKTDAISALTGGVKEKNFFLHYEFPSYATNEIGKSSHRRELGHGALAEKALKSVVPADHPFTIRLTSEVLESNGSSSMASVCGGSMALMDAGVPISMPAAGVAIGLVSRPHPDQTSDSDPVTSRDYQVLVDIMGLEDFMGDMDFKLAGTRQGITALQADIKLPGLPFKIVREAAEKGHLGITHILDIMDASIESPRVSKPNWPVSKEMTVPIHQRAKFVGPGGMNLKRLMVDTGVTATASPTDQTVWKLFGPNSEAMEEAEAVIEMLLAEEKPPDLEFGAIYTVKITEIKERGVNVEMHPTMPHIYISNAQLDARKVMHSSALGLEVGQDIQVKYFGRDPTSGSVRLSRKVLTVGAASAVKQLKTAVAANRQARLEQER